MRKTIVRAVVLSAAAFALAGPSLIGAAPMRSYKGQAYNGPARAPKSMSFAALERRATDMGIQPTELKVKYRVAEIEGWDSQGRKVEVKLDPATGQVFRHGFDD